MQFFPLLFADMTNCVRSLGWWVGEVGPGVACHLDFSLPAHCVRARRPFTQFTRKHFRFRSSIYSHFVRPLNWFRSTLIRFRLHHTFWSFRIKMLSIHLFIYFDYYFIFRFFCADAFCIVSDRTARNSIYEHFVKALRIQCVHKMKRHISLRCQPHQSENDSFSPYKRALARLSGTISIRRLFITIIIFFFFSKNCVCVQSRVSATKRQTTMFLDK